MFTKLKNRIKNYVELLLVRIFSGSALVKMSKIVDGR